MARERPIFVLGAPRSGTTLLQVMLSCHHRIAIPPETRMVVPAYRQRERFGDLSERLNRRRLGRWLTGRRATRFRDLGLDGRLVRREIVSAPPTLGSALEVVFRGYAALSGSPRWGDKWPSYYREVPALLRLFPDAQFVHLVRDGRDCVASQVALPWFDSVDTAACIWMEAIDEARVNRRRLRTDQWHELRYEDLVRAPQTALRSLCAFLGESYDPAMERPERLAATAVPARKTWHDRVRQPVDGDRVGAAATALDPAQRALLDFALRRRLSAYGYSVEAGRPPAAALARLSAEATRRRLALARRRASDAWLEHRHPAPLSTLLGD